MKTCILAIAGSDTSSGAGIQADIKTAAALGCYAASVVSCVTAQNSTSFEIVERLGAGAVRSQVAAIAAEMPIHAVKVGMIGTTEAVEAVAGVLACLREDIPGLPIVIDPVLGASVGGALSQGEEGYDLALARDLIPQATLLTPNLPEAMALADYCRVIMRGLPVDEEHPLPPPPNADDATSAAWAARILIAAGADAVLVKGGHGGNPNEVVDLLFCGQDLDGVTVHGVAESDPAFSVDLEVPSLDRYIRTPVAYSSPRIDGEFHGTGCALSTAVACGLAQGMSLPDAVGLAHSRLHEMLAHPLDVGGKTHLIDHFGPSAR